MTFGVAADAARVKRRRAAAANGRSMPYCSWPLTVGRWPLAEEVAAAKSQRSTANSQRPTKMNFLIDGPHEAERTLVFAHGAGGAMDTPFLNVVARGVGERGIRVVRFEFPYMAARRTGGKRGAPDRQPVLLQTWRDVVAELGGPNLVIGGKSMGGRMATMVADDLRVRGVVVLGYPFHPPGRPEAAYRASRSDADTYADRAGNARSVRHRGRSRGVSAFPYDPHRVAAGTTLAGRRAIDQGDRAHREFCDSANIIMAYSLLANYGDASAGSRRRRRIRHP